MTGDMIRVVLADDHAVVRAGLKAVLGVGEGHRGDRRSEDRPRGRRDGRAFKPDVIVMDLRCRSSTAPRRRRRSSRRVSPTRVLVLTMHAEEDYLVPLHGSGGGRISGEERRGPRAGGRGARGRARRHLRARRPRRACSRRISRRRIRQQSERERFEKLTERERDVLRLVAQGYSAPEIGEKLFISPKTVDTYKQRIQEKLGLAHRSDYVQLALKLGLLAET